MSKVLEQKDRKSFPQHPFREGASCSPQDGVPATSCNDSPMHSMIETLVQTMTMCHDDLVFKYAFVVFHRQQCALGRRDEVFPVQEENLQHSTYEYCETRMIDIDSFIQRTFLDNPQMIVKGPNENREGKLGTAVEELEDWERLLFAQGRVMKSLVEVCDKLANIRVSTTPAQAAVVPSELDLKFGKLVDLIVFDARARLAQGFKWDCLEGYEICEG